MYNVCNRTIYTPRHNPLIMGDKRRAHSSHGALPVFHISYDNALKGGEVEVDKQEPCHYTILYIISLVQYITCMYIDPNSVIFLLTFYYFIFFISIYIFFFTLEYNRRGVM